MIIKCRAALSCINCHSYSGHPIFAKYALGRCFSFSSCAATRVRAPCPTTPCYAPQVWAFSAKAGHAKEENRQRLEGRLPPTAGSLIFRPTRRVGHDFLELQCGKTNLGQLLLRALEEKAPSSPFSMNALLRWPREILSKRLTMPLTSQSDMMPCLRPPLIIIIAGPGCQSRCWRWWWYCRLHW